MIWLFVNNSEDQKDVNIKYLTGYSPSFCILAYDSKSKKKCMFVTSFEVGQYKRIKNFSFNKNSFKKDLFNYFNIKSLNKIGVNKKSISVRWFNTFSELLGIKKSFEKDIDKEILSMRLLKNPDEIINIKKACTIADKVFNEIVYFVKSGKFLVEKDIYDYILKRGFELSTEVSFLPIVASGKNASLPHHNSDKTKLSGFVVIDIGYKYNGYCSDMTRTIFVESNNRKINKREIELWKSVKEMHDYATKSIRNNIKKGKKVKFNIIETIIRANLGDDFCHSLGHGVGVEIHEAPKVSSTSKDILKEGMTFTIEPGIYKKNKYGIRHENLYVYADGIIKKLTSSTEELIVVKK